MDYTIAFEINFDPDKLAYSQMFLVKSDVKVVDIWNLSLGKVYISHNHY